MSHILANCFVLTLDEQATHVALVKPVERQQRAVEPPCAQDKELKRLFIETAPHTAVVATGSNELAVVEVRA